MELEKLTIKAYSKDDFSGNVGSIKVQINPASYKHEHSVTYNDEAPQGAPYPSLKFKSIGSETVSFDIYFDATGAIANSTQAVQDQVDKFKKLTYEYNGSIHATNYLIVSWGTLVFKCKLTQLSLDYSLFKPDGTPLRVKASVTFKGFLDGDMIKKEANPQSPDLTHVRVFQAGDSLPLICYDIYGDSSYYLDVAERNGIINFRNITPGTQLYFPPLT